MQERLLWGAGIAVAVFGVSALADRRRNRRADPEKVGFMPWALVQVLALLAAAVLGALAVLGD